MTDRGRGGVGTLVMVALLVGAVFAGHWLLTTGRPWLDGGPLADAGDAIRRQVSGFLNGDRPPPGADAQEDRILPKVPIPSDPGPHRFTRRADGVPVTYSPCRRLEVVVNTRGAPPQAMGEVRDAVDLISRSTGLSLTVTGRTGESYSVKRKPYQPERYGERWAPILIAWSGDGSVREFGGDAVGLGGSMAIDVLGTPSSYVTGAVALDREFFADPSHRSYLHEVLVHELGHVVGLDHVADPGQIMWEGGLHGSGLGSGDLAGLAKAGRGPCTPDL
ncbi:MAG: matrixin family metalloprotease [Candidatus Nanopelagicales bacterium]